MALHFTKWRMLGTLEVPLTFEEDLIELSIKMGRPYPELKGGRVDKPEDSEQTWLVSCTVRGVVLDPNIEEIEVDVLDRTWEEGSIRAMQATLARLVHYHRGSHDLGRFMYFGRRDERGFPKECVPHYHFGGHMQHMESLLHRTQVRMDHIRMQRDIKVNTLKNVRQLLQLKEKEIEKKDKELEEVKKDLEKAKADVYREKKIRSTTRKINKRLKSKNDDLETMLAKMESHIVSLEDEGEDLRKENKALLSDDEDYIEEMDIEDEEPDEDDLAFINDGSEDEEEPLLPEEEEDPEERDYDSADD
jgi:hypothetical protein